MTKQYFRVYKEKAMQKLEWRTEKCKVKDLKLFPGNPRKMSKEQAEQLENSLKKFNYVELVACDTKNRIIAGNMRIQALKKLGRDNEVIEVRIPNRELTEAEAREYLLRSNRNTGSWNYEELANFDESLLTEVGFEPEELDNIFELDNFLHKTNDIPSSSEVNELTEKLLKFPSDKWGIPFLDNNKILKIDKKVKISLFSTSKVIPNSEGTKVVLWQHKKQFSKKEEGFLCFYTEDKKFDTIWYDTKKFCQEIKDQHWQGIILPNWSLYPNDPFPLSLWNIFKTRYIGAYLQQLNIPIIPDVNWSTNESFEFCFLGLQKDIPVISIQTQNILTKKDLLRFKVGLKKAISLLTPKSMLFYGQKLKNIIKNILDEYDINDYIFIPTFSERYNETKKKGDQNE